MRQAEDVVCDGAETLAWEAAAVPPLRQKSVALIGSGDGLVTMWRRMLLRVSSVLLSGGYGIVGARGYIPSGPTKAHLHHAFATWLELFKGRVVTVEGRLSRSPEGSDSTQPQPSLLVSICSGQRACRTAGVCRSGAGLEATGLPPRQNPASQAAIIFCSSCCAQQILL